MGAPKERFIHLPLLGKVPLSPKRAIADLRKRQDAPTWAQFIKYGVFGVISACIMLTTTLSIAALFPDFLDHRNLTIKQFALHLMITHAIGFIPCNIFTYLTNRRFVFAPGKHSTKKEFTQFTLVSVGSFIIGEIGVYWTKVSFSESENSPVLLATLLFIAIATIVNFSFRKLFIFNQ